MRKRCGLIAAAALIGAVAARGADYPSWWISRGVVNTNAAATNDYAASNQGQAKWFATNAYDEFQIELPRGAGAELGQTILSLPASNDYQVLNLGQLKNLAEPFHARLVAEGFAAAYPWTAAVTDDVDYAAANLGQLKNLFAFDPGEDADADGLADMWEMRYFGSLTNQAAGDDYDGDGTDNLSELLQGRDPTEGASPDTNGVVNLLVYTPME